jgi:ATP-dependent Lon protease
MSNNAMSNNEKNQRVCILPLRDIVIFPHMVVPLFVGREKSVKALEHVMEHENLHLLLVTQKSASIDDPDMEDLYTVGTLSKVLQMLKLPDGTVKVLVEGVQRAYVRELKNSKGYFEAKADVIEEKEDWDNEEHLDALKRSVLSQFEQYLKLNRKIPADVLITLNQIEDPVKLSDTLASYLTLKIKEKQELLEIGGTCERLQAILHFMEAEMGVMQVEKKIRSRVKEQMEKSQREYYLNEQMKAIQQELGDGADAQNEIRELEEKIKKLKMTKEARDKCDAEIRKLKGMNPMSAEATVVRNYLDVMVSIPWSKQSKLKRDIDEAESILNRDHYGLEKVKERIIEYLAVQNRVGKVRSQILCLVGPPGVGKTSLARSVAEATGRQYVRMALGGVRDESEIRGHRRTYIGSMPGKIVQGLRKAKTSNPLFLLDEIDKLGNDWRGDPSSALLEVLDPEQNATFNDHYLEVDYDLSDVMFLTTANSYNIPGPLLDRMEIINLSGYTEEEKLQIALKHLLPKQSKLHALEDDEIIIEEAALRRLIRRYTREAGVRNLEREVANLCRKAVKKLTSIEKESKLKNDGKNIKKHCVHITKDNLKDYAGIPRYHYGLAEESDSIGVTTGLAWTSVGGDLLSIEVLSLPGNGKRLITGKLGDVMQESVQAALSYVRAHAHTLGLSNRSFEKKDFHIHVPEGAIPKDGPSAGITMATSIVSSLTQIPVRKDIAMTGEITLRGRVLAIGGLKEKLLAAGRGGIKTVLIPHENEKDLEDVPDVIKGPLHIIPVKDVMDVLKVALTHMPEPLSPELIAEDMHHYLPSLSKNEEKDHESSTSSH